MRFGDELQVVYDIQEEDFSLPALVVQPLVENAIRYGIEEKKTVEPLQFILGKRMRTSVSVSKMTEWDFPRIHRDM